MSISMSTATSLIEKIKPQPRNLNKKGVEYLLEEPHDNIQRTADGSSKTFKQNVRLTQSVVQTYGTTP